MKFLRKLGLNEHGAAGPKDQPESLRVTPSSGGSGGFQLKSFKHKESGGPATAALAGLADSMAAASISSPSVAIPTSTSPRAPQPLSSSLSMSPTISSPIYSSMTQRSLQEKAKLSYTLSPSFISQHESSPIPDSSITIATSNVPTAATPNAINNTHISPSILQQQQRQQYPAMVSSIDNGDKDNPDDSGADNDAASYHSIDSDTVIVGAPSAPANTTSFSSQFSPSPFSDQISNTFPRQQQLPQRSSSRQTSVARPFNRHLALHDDIEFSRDSYYSIASNDDIGNTLPSYPTDSRYSTVSRGLGVTSGNGVDKSNGPIKPGASTVGRSASYNNTGPNLSFQATSDPRGQSRGNRVHFTRSTLVESGSYCQQQQQQQGDKQTAGSLGVVRGPTPRQRLTEDEILQLAVQCHDRGELEKATAYFKKAADLKNPVGMLFYGLSLRHGWGCQANEKLAFSYLQKAGQVIASSTHHNPHGHKLGINGVTNEELSMALYELGTSYRHGWGVPICKKTAAYYFEIAANNGDGDAQVELASCYEKGEGVKRDMKKAAYYYRLAYNQGHEIFGNSWIFKKKYDGYVPEGTVSLPPTPSSAGVLAPSLSPKK